MQVTAEEASDEGCESRLHTTGMRLRTLDRWSTSARTRSRSWVRRSTTASPLVWRISTQEWECTRRMPTRTGYGSLLSVPMTLMVDECTIESTSFRRSLRCSTRSSRTIMASSRRTSSLRSISERERPRYGRNGHSNFKMEHCTGVPAARSRRQVHQVDAHSLWTLAQGCDLGNVAHFT